MLLQPIEHALGRYGQRPCLAMDQARILGGGQDGSSSRSGSIVGGGPCAVNPDLPHSPCRSHGPNAYPTLCKKSCSAARHRLTFQVTI